MSQSTTNRRQFLHHAAAATAAGTVAPYWFAAQEARADETSAASDRPHVGADRCGDRGRHDRESGRQVRRLRGRLRRRSAASRGGQGGLGGKADVYQDYRKLLDRKDIDVVVNATPDHWHTAINVAACRAGKDVYAEKPLTLTIDEGKLLCRVVEETGRIVQVGTQQRSDRQLSDGRRAGAQRPDRQAAAGLGRPALLQHQGRAVSPSSPCRRKLDWDLYQGQAPQHRLLPRADAAELPLVVRICRRNHHRLGQPPHRHRPLGHGLRTDRAGRRSKPAACSPTRAGADYYNTPDRFFSRMVYPNGVEMLYFASLGERMPVRRRGQDTRRHDAGADRLAVRQGRARRKSRPTTATAIMFIGEKGRVFVNRGGVYGKACRRTEGEPVAGRRLADADAHATTTWATSSQCVKSRKQPVSPVRIAAPHGHGLPLDEHLDPAEAEDRVGPGGRSRSSATTRPTAGSNGSNAHRTS